MPDKKNRTSFYLIIEFFFYYQVFFKACNVPFCQGCVESGRPLSVYKLSEGKFANISKSLNAHMFGPAIYCEEFILRKFQTCKQNYAHFCY